MKTLKNPTLLISLAICLFFLSLAFWFPIGFKSWIASSAHDTLDIFGGFYLYLGFFVVVIMVALAFSPFGKLKLGSGKIAYSRYSWVAMLYSTGMGAGLMLRAVQEPVFYYTEPPRESSLRDSAFALEYTFFHWGLTPWAFYGMFGLIIAFLVYGKNRSMLSSSILSGRFHHPFLSLTIDVITIISTLFGVVGAVGLGSRQLLAGCAMLFGQMDITYNNNAFMVLFLGSLATISAYAGLSRGIRNLSRFNIALALLLLVTTYLMGEQIATLVNLFEGIKNYLLDFVPMSLNLESMKVDKNFLMDWTYFYWAFWLAWAPFTGVFIARISKGRTIREFIIGVLVIPSLGTFLWFAVFGTQAFALIGSPESYQGEYDSLYGSIFVFFDQLPFSFILKLLSLILVFTFLITSIDSAIYVLGMFSDQGKTEPKKSYLLIWGLLLVSFTVGTIFIGKEELLAAVSQILILIAIPFSAVFGLMIGVFLYTLVRKN
ncbi:MAG: BCCT family transporter [Cyclobacteriaceae bacterium]